MSLKKALLIFDPFRRPEQFAYVAARTEVLHEVGDRAWVAITEAQAERFTGQGIAVQFREAVDWIDLPAVFFNPLEQEPVVPEALRAPAPAGDATAYYLVQFIVPPVPDWIVHIADLGGEDVQSIPESVVVFRLTAAQVPMVEALPFVRWVGQYHPAYALNYQLAGRRQAATALELQTLAVDASRLPPSVDEQGNLQITLFADLTPGDVRSAVESAGAIIRFETAQGFVVDATADVLAALLAVPGIFSVEPFAPPEITNDRGRAITNTPAVSRFGNIAFQVNLDGAGEIAGVIDMGLDHGNPDNLATLHADLRGRILRLIHHTNPNATPTPAAAQVPDRGLRPGATNPHDHGTHVAGSIAGGGTSSGGRIKGMAPAAHIVFQGPLQGGLREIQAFRLAHRLGARVHNNSWGRSNGGTPPPPTNNQYQATASDLDRFCLLYPESLILFTTGNDEEDTTGGADGNLDMDRVRFHAAAKNILAVGASESFRADNGEQRNYRETSSTTQGTPFLAHANFDALAGGKRSDNPDQVALFSGRGQVNTNAAVPVATGRFKPDIVAPGTNILSLRSSLVPRNDSYSYPDGVNANLHDFKSGTSMAAPLTTGAAVLVRQFYRQRFGRLRRLVLLEGVMRTATPPPDFVGLPTMAPHADGVVFAWVTPAAGSAQKRIVASVYTRDLTRLHAQPILLQDDVGDSPTPGLARHGEHTLLLYRHGGGELRLSRYQKDPPPGFNLSLDTGFDTDGTAVVDTGADASADRPAALVVAGDDVAVAWTGAGTALRWRRFSAADGSAREAGPVELGSVAATSPHAYLIHNGTRYAAVWAHRAGDTRSIRFAGADDDGNLTGADPLSVAGGAFDMYGPHLAWNGRANRFAVAWCERHGDGNLIKVRFLNADGTLAPEEATATRVPNVNTVRRPFIAAHPDQGYVLAWEDNWQGGQFAVHLALLGENGRPDTRLGPNPLDPDNRRLLRISDTVQDTQGLAALTDGAGTVVAWQSLDEARPDRLDVSSTTVSLDGSFRAQLDLRNPLIVGGTYRPFVRNQQGNTALDCVAMAWAGGDYYFVRWESAGFPAPSRLTLARADAAGRSDTTYGNNGSRDLSTSFMDRRCELHWTGTQLACVISGNGFISTLNVHACDAAGDPLDGSKPGTVAFGVNGIRTFAETAHGDVRPQLGDIDLAAPDFGIIVAYGAGGLFANTLRYAVLNRRGQFIDGDGNTVDGAGNPIAPVVLFTHPNPNGTIGTARHGWFHFVETELRRSIAVWHQRDNISPAARFDVFIRRFDRHGTGLGAAPVALLPRAAGDTFDAMNAVVEPRPDGVASVLQSRRREYGVAWQHRNAPADPWEIRFSRLDRTGAVVPDPPPPPTPANPNQQNIRVIFPGLTDAGGTTLWPPDAGTPMNAMEPQLACTYTDAPWRPLPGAAALLGNILTEWAPGYGLAWVGQPVAGGNRILYFTVLDENGNRLQLDALPVPAVPPGTTPTVSVPTAPLTQISRSGADVRDFKLIWNGRVFHLTWTEAEGNSLRHMHAAVTRHGYLGAYAQPSSALLRATLINGATNINDTSLPNLPAVPITNTNRNHGYGWGRVNVRQSLAPSAPVTFYASDDGAVGPGQTARYRFALPAGTALLRATLVWTDPPGARVVHNLSLRVRGNGREYHGNTWSTAANHLGESQAVPAAQAFDNNQSIEQIVVVNPAAGDYDVEVVAQAFAPHQLYPFPAQPFALVFVGSGPEVRYQREVSCDLPVH